MLGINDQTVRKITREGLLPPIRIIGRSYVYDANSVKDVQRRFYRSGYTHGDIAAMYGVSYSAVVYWFERIGVEPDGVNRHIKRAPVVYDKETVENAARQLGWTKVEDTIRLHEESRLSGMGNERN